MVDWSSHQASGRLLTYNLDVLVMITTRSTLLPNRWRGWWGGGEKYKMGVKQMGN